MGARSDRSEFGHPQAGEGLFMKLDQDLVSPASRQAAENASDCRVENHGLTNLRRVYWNLPTAALYEEASFAPRV